ncbi:hypothetical protein E8E13_008873 [Curvularia kusanoi]|uniref:Uncharacterized protein n=1 Tax=Curvularia kusanoi TaxID=90978 RepID=A0A9P4TGP2_CURKU|nr:hypothetical protein E8E13_008873 [Curvularia kusanoi]
MSPSYFYKSPSGLDWADSEDDFNLDITPVQSPGDLCTSATLTAPDVYEMKQSVPNAEEADDEESDSEEVECSEYVSTKVVKAWEHLEIRPNYALAVQETWGSETYIDRPAYIEMSCDGLYVYPDKRTNYSANWLRHKAEQRANMNVPLKIRPSPLSLWLIDSKGDHVIENGIMTQEQLPPPSVNDGHLETKERDTFEPPEFFTAGEDQAYDYNDIDAVVDIPPSDDEIEVDTDLSPAKYRSLMSDLGSENIFDSASSGDEYDEFDSELESEEEDSKEKSDDENQGALASPISSATSDHGDVDEAELDEENVASTSPIKDEDYCEVLHFTLLKPDQSAVLDETAEAITSSLSLFTNTHAASSKRLEESVGSESADHYLTAAVDPFDISTDTGLVLADTHRCGVSSEEVQVVTLSSTASVEVDTIRSEVSDDIALSNYASYNQSEQHKEEDMAEFEDSASLFIHIDQVTGPVQDDDIFSPPTESLPSSEQADYTRSEHCNEESRAVTEDYTPIIEETSPTPISVGEFIPSLDASNPASIDLVDYSETKRNAEDRIVLKESTSPAIAAWKIRKAIIAAAPTIEGSLNPGSAPHTRLSQTHSYTSAILNKFATGYFAVSTLPWMRIGAAAMGMGIMYTVATRVLRR